MAVRQYIGARYCPRFTGLYDNTQSYEALDVVDNGSGTSYIAKKPTPANTPLTDTDYWFLYGSTNGAIINLQQQIDDMKDGSLAGSLQNQINENTDDIKNLEVLADGEYIRSLDPSELLVVADSFGQNPLGNVLNGFNTCLNGINTLVQGGATFGTFATLLTNYTGDKDDIKSIILIGGTNQHSVASVETDFDSIKTAAEDYPNAKIYIAFIKSNFDDASERALVNPLLAEIKKQCLTHNFLFMGNFNHCLYPTFAIIGSDGIHPTPSGGDRIGSAIFNKYANGIDEPLLTAYASATAKGLTFTLYCDETGELSVRVSGTTNDTLSAGAFISIPFDTYYYLSANPAGFTCTHIHLSNGGVLILGLNSNELKFYYSPEGSGSATIPSGTSITAQCSVLKPIGNKKYLITNS